MTDYTRQDLERIGEKWLDKIRQAEKREDDWIKDAERAEYAYTAGQGEVAEGTVPSFNILHSNVETIVPSIFNSSPRPEIRPRHNTKDEVGKVVSDIYERSISTQIDDDRLDAEVERTAQDTFLAGRGVTRIRFDADEVEAQYEVMQVVGEDGEIYEEEVEATPAHYVNERVVYENVSWRDFRMGPAKRWRDVPWVCFRHEVSEQERERLEDPELAKKQKEDHPDEDQGCSVWEIWCKETGHVYFVVEESGKVLSIAEDPLGLSGFFPVAEPIQPIVATGKMIPVCPYAIYEKLAEELDRATRRINAIMKGLKIRGVIAGDSDVAEVISTLGDNQVAPLANMENLAAIGGLDKAVMWWPVEQAIAVLQQLYAQRNEVKQSIYEITGISDIIRGQGAASETATAQQIKTEWGALRIKKMQRLIERHVRDLFILSAEVMANHFTIEGFAKASGMQEVQAPEVQQMLAKPLDHYRIDVESDSTVRADMTKSRQEMAQFLEGTGQFFNTMGALIAQAPETAGPVVDMYSSFARQFNLGKGAEDALEQLGELAKQAANQPRENPEAKAAEAEAQMKMQEFQLKAEETQQKLKLEEERFKLEAIAKKLENENKQADLRLKAAELALKREQLQLQEAEAEMDAAATMAEIEIEQDQRRAAKVGDD